MTTEMTPAKECLYDVRWQLKRMRWAKYGWLSRTHAEDNIKELLAYIGEVSAKKPEHVDERYMRTWRGIQVLIGVRATLERGTATDIVVLHALSGLKREHQRLKSLGASYMSWDWQKVANELDTLYFHSSGQEYMALKKNLEKRAEKARKLGGTEYRPELMRFLRLMRDIEFLEPKEPV